MSYVEACLSCSTGNETAFIWDLQNGLPLHTFAQIKAGNGGQVYSAPQHVVISAHTDRPQLTLHYATKQTPKFRCTVAERMVSMAASDDGVHVAGGGVSGKLYLWRVSDGLLLGIWDAHYKAVTAVHFTADGGFVVSASEDATCKSWNLGQVLDAHRPLNSEVRPTHSYSGHTLGITGMALSRLHQTWVVTVSKDRTLRVHDFVSGRDVHCCILPSLPKCVAANLPFTTFHAGCTDGKIYQTDLYPERLRPSSNHAPQQKLLTALLGHTTENTSAPADTSALGKFHTAVFEGHSGGVTALATSADGLSLVSGGADGNVHVWQVASRQLIRAHQNHKSPITALQLVVVPTAMPSERESQNCHPFAPLKKAAITGEAKEDYMAMVYTGGDADDSRKRGIDAVDFTGKRQGKGKRRRRQQDTSATAAVAAAAPDANGTDEPAATEAPAAVAAAPAAPANTFVNESASYELIARLYNIVATQQKKLKALEAQAA
eukprot:TRINITY_DN19561_c0_g1_i1.p1 TRINITY_DN19561_c0_g1~~TRINITY_DN19561_c0_g1_i1.p1  ORF type:complete len:516 (+),score=180.28 TRINITY_DN19561_c0_g1_i1:79-1548(+)